PGQTWQLPLAGSPSWSALAPTGASPPDLNGGLVYDSARDRVELVRADGSVWALSMSAPPAWSQLSTTPLPSGPRTAPSVVFDGVGDRLLFHGGPGLNDTWAFAL